jgi:uncharacterized membrane protein
MDAFLEPVFSLVCGRDVLHSWAPDGTLLPFCQRCTGLYAGAAAAFVLLVVCRVRATARFFWVHGAFLLAMAPQGFHLVYQNELLRVVSGTLFGFGLVAFLMPETRGDAARVSTRWYATGLCATLVSLPLLANYGGAVGALFLRVLALAGFAVYAALIARFLGSCARYVWRRAAVRPAA